MNGSVVMYISFDGIINRYNHFRLFALLIIR